MSFDINVFKAKLNEYGGPSKLNLFEVELTGAIGSTIIPPGDLRFFCQSVQAPGINLVLIENRPQGLGLPQSFPTSQAVETLNCSFIMDSKHQILSFFHLWMQNIINMDTSGGLFSPNRRDSNHFPHEINYRNEYEMTMTIKYYGVDKTLYTIKLGGVYPSQVGSLNLSWDSDSYATLPVNFIYKEIKFQGTGAGSNFDNNTRGFGEIVQSLTSGGPVQRTVDTFTNITADVFSALGAIRRGAGF